MCLQETHYTKEVQKIWKTQWGGQMFFANGTSQARGCIIMIMKKLKTTIHKQYTDPNGRFLMLDMSVQNYRLCLCNIYAPNEDNVEYFAEIVKRIDLWNTESLILAGDFNTALSPQEKYSHGSPTNPGHPKVAKFLAEFCENCNILDIW